MAPIENKEWLAIIQDVSGKSERASCTHGFRFLYGMKFAKSAAMNDDSCSNGLQIHGSRSPTCEQDILTPNFCSHSFRKSIMTCEAEQLARSPAEASETSSEALTAVLLRNSSFCYLWLVVNCEHDFGDSSTFEGLPRSVSRSELTDSASSFLGSGLQI